MPASLHRRHVFATLPAALALCGCAPQVKLAEPRLAVPAAFEVNPGQEGETAGLDRWWEGFADPQLAGLIEDALANSSDARTAYFRIREARALRNQALSERLPMGNLSGGAGVQDGSQLSGTGLTGSTSRVESQNLSFSPSWELDLFGRLAAVDRGAQAEYAAAALDYHATRLALAADVARGLFEARGLAVQRTDAQETLRIALELAKASALGRDRGLVSAADTARLDSDAANARAELARVETALRNAKRSLLVLIGRSDAPTASLAIDDRLDMPPALPKVAPSILLARRPDVLAAQARLSAAVSAMDVDRLALFPRIDLLGGASLNRTSGAAGGTAGLWSFGLGLAIPILDRPRLMARLRATEARGQQAVIAYEAAVQNGFRDADIALANVTADRQRLADLSQAAERARYAFDAARTGYRLGLTDLTTLLQSERSWRGTRSALTAAQSQALVNAVTAFRALGGGWAPGSDAVAPGQPSVPLPSTTQAAM
jgi:NodT family efflux transporter outer membrane factor (OMF) lipoprotein